jgi:ADP-dependent NAD(P)H-hydrate dehydratase / NAD(P)H-hydrate epimerase
MLLVTAAEMRELDRLTIERYGTPGHVLMERAGRGAVEAMLRLFPHVRRKGKRLLVCAGKGNNGGDGFVMARLLRARGARTEVVLFGRGEELQGDAERNYRAYRRGRGVVHEVTTENELADLASRFEAADAVIDAIFGTGLTKKVQGVQASAIELINACGAPVFAVDIPSGLNSDTGQPLGTAVQAEATATFGFAKLGQVLYPGSRHCGELAVVDIGIAAEAIAEQPPRAALLDADAVARLVPLRAADAHKGTCGHLLVIAGSFGKTGAAQLVTRAALRTGAGLVTLCGPRSLYPVYAAAVLEAMTEALPDHDGRIRFDADRLRALADGRNAIVVGPGLGTHDGARQTVRWLLAHAGVPMVLDADALTLVADDLRALRDAAGPTVLTPHPGEMARLTGGTTASVQADRVGTARRFAAEQRCTLVLKGTRTVIADPDGSVWINPTGNPGMASGGMGDALSGITGALLAQGLTASEAAHLAVYVHGAAADTAAAANGEIGLVASDVIAGVPRELAALGKRLGV